MKYHAAAWDGLSKLLFNSNPHTDTWDIMQAPEDADDGLPQSIVILMPSFSCSVLCFHVDAEDGPLGPLSGCTAET